MKLDNITKISKEKAKELGDKHKVDWDKVDIEQFRKGLEVEQEHGDTVDNDMDTIVKITLDHLEEFDDYYDRLEKAEK